MSSHSLDAYWLPFTANRDFNAKPRVISGASGHYYTLDDGTRLYDTFSGLWTSGLGHCHPKIVEAVQQQVAHLLWLALRCGRLHGRLTGMEVDEQRGEVRAVDPEAAAWALMGVAHFVGLRYAIWQEREPPPEALDAVFDVVRHGLEPKP